MEADYGLVARPTERISRTPTSSILAVPPVREGKTYVGSLLFLVIIGHFILDMPRKTRIIARNSSTGEERMPQKFLNTGEIAKYLDINEKKVYSLVKSAGLPATRVTGKWLFPKEMVDKWLLSGVAGAVARSPDRSQCLLIAGSNDPLLESELSRFSATEGGPLIYFARVGSSRGLDALTKGTAQAAAAHILDPKTGEYNLPYLDRKTREGTYLYPLVLREQGVMVRKGNPFGISALRDLTIPGIRFVNRKRGSGTRILLDSLLAEAEILSSQIVGYTREVPTHTDVALAVYRGSADAGLGIRSAARMFGLDFVPLKKERFDIVVSREANDSSPFQSLLEDLKSPAFRKSMNDAGGYEELGMNPITASRREPAR